MDRIRRRLLRSRMERLGLSRYLGLLLVAMLCMSVSLAAQDHILSEITPIDINLALNNLNITNVGYFGLGASGEGCIKQWDGNSWEDQICLPYGGTDVVLADTAGSVGVGTTPGEKLDVAGDIQARSHLHSGVIDTTQGRLYLYSGNADDNYDDPYILSSYDYDGHLRFYGGNGDLLAAIGLDQTLYMGDSGGGSWTWKLGGTSLEERAGDVLLVNSGDSYLPGNFGIGAAAPGGGGFGVNGNMIIGNEGLGNGEGTVINIQENFEVDGSLTIGTEGIFDNDDSDVNFNEALDVDGSLTLTGSISDSADGTVNIVEGLSVTGDATVSGGDITVSKETGWSTIYFPATSNDPGYIRHTEVTNAGVLEIVPGDNFAASDYVSIKGIDETTVVYLTTNGRLGIENYIYDISGTTLIVDDDLAIAGTDVDLIRGDSGYIHSVGRISMGYTTGMDDSEYLGIESTNEAGTLSDDIRFNSNNDLIVTLDSNDNNAYSYFKVQHHSTGDGTDLFWIRSPDGMQYHAGRVGLDTTSPGAQLSLRYTTSDSAEAQIFMDSGDNLYLRNNVQNNQIIVGDNGIIYFYYNGANAASITTLGLKAQGNLYVGVSSSADDDYIYMDYNNYEYIRWDDAPGEVDFSNDVYVTGDVNSLTVQGGTYGLYIEGSHFGDYCTSSSAGSLRILTYCDSANQRAISMGMCQDKGSWVYWAPFNRLWRVYDDSCP